MIDNTMAGLLNYRFTKFIKHPQRRRLSTIHSSKRLAFLRYGTALKVDFFGLHRSTGNGHSSLLLSLWIVAMSHLQMLCHHGTM